MGEKWKEENRIFRRECWVGSGRVGWEGSGGVRSLEGAKGTEDYSALKEEKRFVGIRFQFQIIPSMEQEFCFCFLKWDRFWHQMNGRPPLFV